MPAGPHLRNKPSFASEVGKQGEHAKKRTFINSVSFISELWAFYAGKYQVHFFFVSDSTLIKFD
jgi:hypothetical protein